MLGPALTSNTSTYILQGLQVWDTQLVEALPKSANNKKSQCKFSKRANKRMF